MSCCARPFTWVRWWVQRMEWRQFLSQYKDWRCTSKHPRKTIIITILLVNNTGVSIERTKGPREAIRAYTGNYPRLNFYRKLKFHIKLNIQMARRLPHKVHLSHITHPLHQSQLISTQTQLPHKTQLPYKTQHSHNTLLLHLNGGTEWKHNNILDKYKNNVNLPCMGFHKVRQQQFYRWNIKHQDHLDIFNHQTLPLSSAFVLHNKTPLDWDLSIYSIFSLKPN